MSHRPGAQLQEQRLDKACTQRHPASPSAPQPGRTPRRPGRQHPIPGHKAVIASRPSNWWCRSPVTPFRCCSPHWSLAPASSPATVHRPVFDSAAAQLGTPWNLDKEMPGVCGDTTSHRGHQPSQPASIAAGRKLGRRRLRGRGSTPQGVTVRHCGGGEPPWRRCLLRTPPRPAVPCWATPRLVSSSRAAIRSPSAIHHLCPYLHYQQIANERRANLLWCF